MNYPVVRYGYLSLCLALGLALTSHAETNLGVLVRHAPAFNGPGRIEGSVQQMLGEGLNFNSGFTLTGDMYLPGTPNIYTNGPATVGGVIAGSGSSSPSGYSVYLNSGVTMRYLRTRMNPTALPVVTVPAVPAGTRSVNINAAGQSYGDPATLRNLTLNSGVGQVYVPPGAYGSFSANGGSGFTLGVAGTNTTYHLQSLTLNGATKLLLNGPVLLKVANGFNANGVMGISNSPSWLQIQLANGGLNLNSGSAIYGSITAPAGTVTVNDNSVVIGAVASDRLTINSNGKIIVGGEQAPNQPPVAQSQSLSLQEDSAVGITLAASDPENAPLTYTIVTAPTRGSLSGTPPNLLYRAHTNAFGADSFTFKVNDGAQDSALATVSIEIVPVNDAPVALAQSLSTAEDTVASITLAGTDVEGSGLVFAIVQSPQHGFLEGTPPNLTYVPSNNFNGTDTFTFRVNDGGLDSAPATVSIAVLPINDRPLADAQTVATDEDTAKSIVLTGEDPEFDSLSYTIVTPPAHGTLSGTPPFVTYLPATNFFGTDSFTFKVSDGVDESAPTNVTIQVLPVNDVPVAISATWELHEDHATNLVLTALDVDSTNLQFFVATAPAHGTVTLVGDTATYSPAANFTGLDSFSFAASDGSVTSGGRNGHVERGRRERCARGFSADDHADGRCQHAACSHGPGCGWRYVELRNRKCPRARHLERHAAEHRVCAGDELLRRRFVHVRGPGRHLCFRSGRGDDFDHSGQRCSDCHCDPTHGQ
jgi:hypothetical protein